VQIRTSSARRYTTQNGKLFAKYSRAGSPETFGAPWIAHEGHVFDGEYLKLSHGINLAGEHAGTVDIESDLTEMRARIGCYALIILLVMAGASTAAMLLATKLRTWISEPLPHLAQAVRRVTAQKDYSVRAAKQGNDELGSLIDGFNAMLRSGRHR
jgi:methyl-accepting chemotaxis protein